MSYTTANDADWTYAGLSRVVASQRSTTSSRKPGAAITGTVMRERASLNRCAKCGGFRLLASSEPHAPHYTESPAGLTLVDCTGAEVRR